METGRYAKLFLSESRENLSEINNALLELERGGSTAAIDRLFRAVHSMKGMGGAMGYATVTDLSHELETLLDRLRTGTLTVTPVIMDTLFAGVDALEQAVGLATSATPTELDVTEVLARIRSASSEEALQTLTSEFAIMGTAKSEETKTPVAKTARHIRIDARRLDTLMNLMGELVIARDRIAQVAERLGDEALLEATLRASQIIATLQNEIMTSRMVPVWQVFDRFPRVVRDTARALGKEVEFKIEGKEIELDRSMLDEMGEPVLHLLRNSLDHGIETPAERKKAGKPPTATLTLTAERDRATVLIRVTDDGRGIDQAKVLPRAKKLGLVSAGTTTLSEDELVRIISRPGFSTADKVTDISGRGVGFDIVAKQGSRSGRLARGAHRLRARHEREHASAAHPGDHTRAHCPRRQGSLRDPSHPRARDFRVVAADAAGGQGKRGCRHPRRSVSGDLAAREGRPPRIEQDGRTGRPGGARGPPRRAHRR